MNEMTMTQPEEKSKNTRDKFIASLTPKQVVTELDKFIVGQNNGNGSFGIVLPYDKFNKLSRNWINLS